MLDKLILVIDLQVVIGENLCKVFGGELVQEIARVVRHFKEDVDELLLTGCRQVSVGELNRVQVEVRTVLVVQKLFNN